MNSVSFDTPLILNRLRAWCQAIYNSSVRIIFGDYRGLMIFLLGLSFFMVYWRIGFFITDNNTIGNMLIAIADGHLYIENITYGSGNGSPGTFLYGSRLYGSNYGVVAFTLPFLAALRVVSTVADTRVALSALWALILLALLVLTTDRWDNEYNGFAISGGSLAILSLFFSNVAVATPLGRNDLPIVALQLSTMVAASFCGVLIYRLCDGQGLTRTGTFVGVATVLATPIGFWASLPKRHVLVTLLALMTTYALFAARRADSHSKESLRLRALAYGWVGLCFWVSAPEGALMLFALTIVDILTADDWRPRAITTIAGGFLISLLPFFVTNALISGNPLLPPFLLEQMDITVQAVNTTNSSSNTVVGTPSSISTSGTTTETPSSISTSGTTTETEDPISTLLPKFARLLSVYFEPYSLINRFYHTFIRSGYIPNVTDNSASGAISLSVIESSPLVSGVIAFPVVAYQSKSMLRDHLRTPAGVIHLMFGIYVLILILFYIARLPGHAQITVRYLTPIYPILIYVTARLAHTESILTGNLQTFLWTYSGIVLLGTQSAFAFLMIIDAQVGEAMQFLALVGISAAVPLAIYTITRTIFPGQLPDRLGSVVLALATGSGTVLLLITGLHLFAFTENYALPIVRLLVTLLP